MAKAAKKKAAKKTAKRKYTRRSTMEMEPAIEREVVAMKKSIKQEITEHLNHYNVRFTDQDGHFAIDNSQMISASVMTDLVDIGVQAINARMNMETGVPYIAVYY